MAIRNVLVKDKDERLRKKSRKIEEVTPRILELLADMEDTMNQANGIGIAAPQVGVLKCAIIVKDEEETYKLINPRIIEESGSVVELEGCLSIPGISGEVERPLNIKVSALNLEGKEIVIDAEGYFARIICHEIDHLNGVLFTDKAKNIQNNAVKS